EAPAVSRFEKLIAAVVAANGLVRIDDLVRASGLSARQCRRRWIDRTGLGPKRFSRILRFRHATRLAATSHRWSEIAVMCGYTDQSHLTREFRALSGSTPSASPWTAGG